MIQLLSCKPLTNVGLLSYSLYMWHYPFITILKVEDQLRLLITELLSHSFRSQTQDPELAGGPEEKEKINETL